ncbi:gastric triacylglycerol lipase-like isoform X1 [Limulus polyphemus]|uniref:Lipase n=1 Tax=Limulus polyphemus TaxID=6850 RepID=A0ABM1S570_LIMPO|nr:gastric triacylglycerol lipase-like isoform X1 [Limulus polyphemus]
MCSRNLKLLSLELIFLSLSIAFDKTSSRVDPDAFRNVSQIIRSKGYPVEEYSVQTTDGYILGVQHIPYGRKFSQSSKFIKTFSSKRTIFLQHGLLSSSTDWVINSPTESLGFILADAGYDVWLGNFRGNTYSRKHIKYSTHSKEFWEFSFDEMALLDLPAMIDFVLNKTGKNQLLYVGHSQGTLTAFALLSEKTEYNKKVKTLFALAPVATVGYIKSPIKYLAPYTNDIEMLFKLLGINEFLPNTKFIKFLGDLVCSTEIRIFCEQVIFLFAGVDPKQINATRLPVYISHNPAGTSTQNIVHFAQLVNSKKLVKYNYGKIKNMELYNQTDPPEYLLEKITAPVALFWAQDDWLADVVDIALLQPRLKHLRKSYLVNYTMWSHLDFIWGIDAPKYVYKELLKVLEKY